MMQRPQRPLTVFWFPQVPIQCTASSPLSVFLWLCFAPCYITGSLTVAHVHKVLAYPIRRLSLPSNAVLVFYIMNPPLSPFGKAPAHRRILSKPLFL